MKSRVLLTIVIVSLSAIAAILPQKKNSSVQLSADEVLQGINLGTYKISSDQLTEVIINQDPSYMLIDLRSASEFEDYHFPGAINIPFDSLFTENWIMYIDQDLRNNIFYSNGGSLAGQALVLTRQRGFKNNFVLEGGLNEYFDKVVNAEEPPGIADAQEHKIYQRRKAAQQYFKGGEALPENDTEIMIKPIPVRKKKMVQGGCS